MGKNLTKLALYEKLAAIEHERWADWQKWVYKVCIVMDNGLLIPQEMVDRWQRQIETVYEDLSEKEKDSDRKQVDRYWPLIEEAIAKGSGA